MELKHSYIRETHGPLSLDHSEGICILWLIFVLLLFSKSAKMVALSFTSSQSKPFVQSVQCTWAMGIVQETNPGPLSQHSHKINLGIVLREHVSTKQNFFKFQQFLSNTKCRSIQNEAVHYNNKTFFCL